MPRVSREDFVTWPWLQVHFKKLVLNIFIFWSILCFGDSKSSFRPIKKLLGIESGFKNHFKSPCWRATMLSRCQWIRHDEHLKPKWDQKHWYIWSLLFSWAILQAPKAPQSSAGAEGTEKFSRRRRHRKAQQAPKAPQSSAGAEGAAKFSSACDTAVIWNDFQNAS